MESNNDTMLEVLGSLEKVVLFYERMGRKDAKANRVRDTVNRLKEAINGN
jgi:hypothetical protein